MSASTLDLLAARIDQRADAELRRRIDDAADPLRVLMNQLGASSASVSFPLDMLPVSNVITMVVDAIHADHRDQNRAEAVRRFLEERADGRPIR